jgi:hypothetical protein
MEDITNLYDSKIQVVVNQTTFRSDKEVTERHARPNAHKGPFDIPLQAFALQPWNNKGVNLSQWFNYGFTPQTWEQYCEKQRSIAK